MCEPTALGTEAGQTVASPRSSFQPKTVWDTYVLYDGSNQDDFQWFLWAFGCITADKTQLSVMGTKVPQTYIADRQSLGTLLHLTSQSG